MAITYKNFAEGHLAVQIDDVTTALLLGTGQGAFFPTTDNGAFYYIVLSENNGLKREICKVVLRTGDLLTVERAQFNTTAQSFEVNDQVELNYLAEYIPDQSLNKADTPTFNGVKIETPVMPMSTTKGQIFYDDDCNVLAVDIGEDQPLRVGVDQIFYVVNQTGSTMFKGQVAVIDGSGSVGSIPHAKLVLADTTENTRGIIGVLIGDIQSGEYGHIIAAGKLRNVDTTRFLVGAEVFASPITPGEITNIRPSKPNVDISLGIVTKSHLTEGEILLNIFNTTSVSDIVQGLAPATTGTSILRGDGFGGFMDAIPSIDYALPGINYDITEIRGLTSPLSVGQGGTGTTTSTGSGSVVLNNSPTFLGTATTNNLTVAGNLVVTGTTVTANASVMTVKDPIITLGGDGPPTLDDNKDRGVEFRWHDGTLARTGFFGFDDSTRRFTFIPQGINTAETYTGAKGDIDVNFVYALGIGQDIASMHTVPYVAADTLAVLNATQTFTNKTSNNTVLTGITLFDNGTAAAPSISFSSDTDTGIFRHSANTIGFAAGGSMAANIKQDSTMSGALNIGSTASYNTTGLSVNSTYSGSSTFYGIYNRPTTNGTNNLGTMYGYYAAPTVDLPSATGLTYYHMRLNTIVRTAGVLTNYYGIYIDDAAVATNHYGIRTLISSGANKWNIYSSGTALNYFNGSVLVGTTTDDGTNKLQVNGGITGTALGITLSGSNVVSVSGSSTAQTAFSYTPTLSHSGDTFGAGFRGVYSPSAGISNHYGLDVRPSWQSTNSITTARVAHFRGDATSAHTGAITTLRVIDIAAPGTSWAATTAPTNWDQLNIGDVTSTHASSRITGMYSGVSAASHKWNVYAVGTAKNYFNGSVLIGTTTDDGTNKLQVAGGISITGSFNTTGDIFITRNAARLHVAPLDDGNGSVIGVAFNNAAGSPQGYVGRAPSTGLYGFYDSTGIAGWSFWLDTNKHANAINSIRVGNGDATTPAYSFRGDVDTGLYSAGANSIGISTGGAVRAIIDSSGRFLLGHSASIASALGSTTTYAPAIQNTGTTVSTSSTMSANFSTSASGTGAIFLAHSASGTVGSFTSTVSGITLGSVIYNGSNATNFIDAARIEAISSGNASTYVPTYIRFVQGNAAGSAMAETMRVTAEGRLGIGRTAPTQLLDVNGDARINDTLRLGSNALGTAGGNNNLLRPDADSAWLNIKGGAGRAKMYLGNDLTAIVGGNTGNVIEFRVGADSDTSTGTRAMYITSGGNVAINEPSSSAYNLSAKGTFNFQLDGSGVFNIGGLTSSAVPMLFNPTLTPTGTTDRFAVGLRGTINTAAAGGTYYAIDLRPSWGSATPPATAITTHIRADSSTAQSGAVTNLYAAYIGSPIWSGAGKCTNVYQLYVEDAKTTSAATPAWAGTGTAANILTNAAAQTNKWNIRALGTAENLFEANNSTFTNVVTIGTNKTSTDTTLNVTGIVKATGEIISTSANGFRIRGASYGTILRNDNSDFWILPTVNGSPDAGWSDARPFSFKLDGSTVRLGAAAASGAVTTEIGSTTANSIIDIKNNAYIRGTLGLAGSAAEGGQLVLGYKNVTPTGQQNSTWNVDVGTSNEFRIFRQNSSGATTVPVSISEAGHPTLNNTVKLGSVSANAILKTDGSSQITTATAGTDYAHPGTTSTWTASQKTNITSITTGTVAFKTAGPDFVCTASSAITLSFTGADTDPGRKGSIVLVNTSGHAVGATLAHVKISSTLLSQISQPGTYWLSYWHYGTNAVAVTGTKIT